MRSISLLCDAARTQDGHVRRVHIDLVEHICRSSLLPPSLPPNTSGVRPNFVPAPAPGRAGRGQERCRSMIAAGMEVQSSPMQWSSFLLAASNDLERLPLRLSLSLSLSSPVDLVWYGRAIAFLPSTRRARWVAVARSLGWWRATIACSLARVLQQEKEDDATPRGSNEQRGRRTEHETRRDERQRRRRRRT